MSSNTSIGHNPTCPLPCWVDWSAYAACLMHVKFTPSLMPCFTEWPTFALPCTQPSLAVPMQCTIGRTRVCSKAKPIYYFAALHASYTQLSLHTKVLQCFVLTLSTPCHCYQCLGTCNLPLEHHMPATKPMLHALLTIPQAHESGSSCQLANIMLFISTL